MNGCTIHKLQLRCTIQLFSPIMSFDQHSGTKIWWDISPIRLQNFLINQRNLLHIYRLLHFRNLNHW